MRKNPTDRILLLLKMRGQATVQFVAGDLAITKEGARKHLLNLAEQELVTADVRSEGVGRPTTYYSLSAKGLSKFPDAHAEVTVQLLQSIKNLLGENALELLIRDREKDTYERYAKRMDGAVSLEGRLELLTRIRSEEGYMAEWKKEDNEYLLLENHCPICAAASECQGFCRSELRNFKELIGPAYHVERVEYIIEGGQRCAYKIKPVADAIL